MNRQAIFVDGLDLGRDVQIDGANYAPAQNSPTVDNQHSDARYQSAWANVDAQSATAIPAGQQPAYPGGPIDGDLNR